MSNHPIRCRLAIAFAALALVLASRVWAEERLLHVAPNGDDRAQGDAATPLATPHAAIERLVAIAADSPAAQVRVVLHQGVFRIDRPLTIGPQHVPARGSLTFAAAGDGPAVISGGRAIAGWQVAADGTWSVALPEVAAGKWRFRELFVAGQRRPRARHPNVGFARIDRAFDDKRSGFTFQAGDLPDQWTGGGELVFLHDWSISRIAVKQVAHESRRLTVANPIGNRADHYKIDHFEPHPRYFVEGHPAFLDAPGEWLLADDGVLHYRPLAEEKPAATVAIAPYATALVVVAGDDARPVRNVRFEGLAFEHCAWQLPAFGYAGSQATAHERRDAGPSGGGRNFIPAAIRWEKAEDCAVARCRVAHLGTSGIEFGSRTRNCLLEDSIVEDIAGNGVNLGEDTARLVDGKPWWQSAPEQAAAGHVVQHNRIERCGQQFFGAVAVWVGIARDMRISNNEIAHHPYTGISLGWMWNPTPTPAGGHRVTQNHIHHVMQVLSDGGGIYTLGRQPGLKLTENVIHDVPLNAGRAESNGMFLDEGSDQSEIVANVIYQLARSPLRFHRAEQVQVRNNKLVVPHAGIPSVRYNNTDPQKVKQFENRVVLQAEFDPTTITLPPTGPRR